MPTLSRCSRQSRKRKTLGESAASPACCRPDKAAVVSAAVQPGTERTMGGTRGPEQQLGDLCTEEEEEGFRIHVGLLLSSPFCFVSVTRASLEAARWGCGGGKPRDEVSAPQTRRPSGAKFEVCARGGFLFTADAFLPAWLPARNSFSSLIFGLPTEPCGDNLHSAESVALLSDPGDSPEATVLW